MILPSSVAFANVKLKEYFINLEKGDDFERKLFRYIASAIKDIENNAFCGIQIKKNQIPRIYKKSGLTNLWKYNLPAGQRLIYTIIDNKIIIISMIIDWMDHKEYEKRFKY